MKVVFHVNELSKWSSVIKNIENLLAIKESEVIAIEVIANGEAVKGYTQADLGIIFHEELVEKGVNLIACQNALTHFDISKKDIHSFVKVVPAGVLRLIELQTIGYAYIKA